MISEYRVLVPVLPASTTVLFLNIHRVLWVLSKYGTDSAVYMGVLLELLLVFLLHIPKLDLLRKLAVTLAFNMLH